MRITLREGCFLEEWEICEGVRIAPSYNNNYKK